MANRHAHKKLRAEVRARMRKTGESYQRTLEDIRGQSRPRVALTPIVVFGHPFAIATLELHGMVINMLVGNSAPLLAGRPLGMS